MNRDENSENQLFDTTEALESLYKFHTYFKASKKEYCAFYTSKSINSLSNQNLEQKNFLSLYFNLILLN